ncbi:MAG TPA: RagB/SusD family nutrient uptake outer membrane protein, partial [Bacteroidales bacterium]|nr:RagB/SusD family nutrient uptake outer membrane protein [Bacteroidales bacterium]
MKQHFLKNKINKLSVLLTIFMLSISSCNEFLDQKPTDGLVLDEYWQNKEQVLNTLGGAYQNLAGLDYLLFVHGELRGDMLVPAFKTGGPERTLMAANIESNHWFARWDKFYEVINVCNHVIDYAPNVSDPTFTDYLKQQYVSEATFIRSLVYFYMVRIWKDVPYITEPTSTDEVEFFPEKTSGDVILNNIKSDLIAIRNKMPDHPTIEMNKSRATAGAVNALLADISLWNFEYDDCIKYIDAVENSGEYFLLPSTEWFDNFNPGFTLENIFEIYYDQGQPNNIATKVYSSKVNDASFFASEYAREILSVEETEANEVIRGAGALSYYFQVWKYQGDKADQITQRTGNEARSANFIVYRLADLYLMKAEAYSQKDAPEFDKALDYLNQIRNRANRSSYVQFSNAKDFEDAILLERAKELAYEGKRWFDLLRMGRRNNYARKAELVEILVQNVPSTQRLV